MDVPTNDVVDDQHVPTIPSLEPSTRFARIRQSSTRWNLNEYVLLTNRGEPECYEEKKEWVDVMEDEMRSLHDSHVFELVKLPKGKRTLKNR